MIHRTFWVSVTTVAELLKDRTITGIFIVGIAMILGGYVVAEMAVVERLKMFMDTGIGAIYIVSVFITLMAGSNLLGREIREKEILCTLSKPTPRSVWILGKTFGLLAAIAILVFSLSTVLFFYMRFQMHVWRPDVFLAGVFIYLEIIILCNYVVLFSCITTQYLSVFSGILVLLAGGMVDNLKIYWDSASPIARWVTRALYYVLPNLEAYSPGPILSNAVSVPASLFFTMVISAAMYVAVAVTLSVVIIRNKEMV
ncbi:MAG TPA: hypothetical protein PLN69_09295 [bacterium]|nr:hypothetical protein [bacterium]